MIKGRKVTPNHQAKIIKAVLCATLLFTPSLAQTKPQITQSADIATCSNVVVSGGNATFKCSGLTKEQAELLRDVPALLNRLLKSQQLSTDAILSKLNACVEESAARGISPEVARNIIDRLRQLTGSNHFSVMVSAPSASPESSQYAEQIRTLFSAAGWNAPPVIYPMMESINGGPVPPGITVFAYDQSSPAANTVWQAFQPDIKADFEQFPAKAENTNSVAILVGQKPVK